MFKQEELGEVWAEYFGNFCMWRMRGRVGSGRPSRVPSTRDNTGRGRKELLGK